MSEQQLQTAPAVVEVDPDDELLSPTSSTAAAVTGERPSRPAGVPEKFWNPESGTLRTEALLKSYLELERKLGSTVPLPVDAADQEGRLRMLRVLGVPESADQYRLEPRHELIEPDPEINAKLHEAGFTEQQAQLVYDLAADHLVPLIDDAFSELRATREAERLAARFGGEGAWRTTAQQIKTWGQANLAPDVFQTLAASYDGVLAVHQMMQGREPAVLNDANGPRSGVDEADLARMMRDPRYWRERDPAFVAQVTAGFERLYPSQT
jgi:Phage T7 capsid assembly protein